MNAPTQQELMIIGQFIDSSHRVNGRALFSVRLAIDVAFENAVIKEKYDERMVVNLLTQKLPIIDFIKWFSTGHQMTAEINAFIRQRYPNGLCVSEYEYVANLLESEQMTAHQIKSPDSVIQQDCSTVHLGCRAQQTSDIRCKPKGQTPPRYREDGQLMVSANWGYLRRQHERSLKMPVQDRQSNRYCGLWPALTQRLRILAQQCVAYLRSWFSSK